MKVLVFSSSPQALQGHSLHVFVYALLYSVVFQPLQALVPFPFRVQVSCSPRSHLSRTPATSGGNSLSA